MITTSLNNAESMAIQTMFDSLSISVPKTAKTTTENVLNKVFDKASLLKKYETRFELVFDYVFLSVSRLCPFPPLSYLANTYCRPVSPLYSWLSLPSSRCRTRNATFVNIQLRVKSFAPLAPNLSPTITTTTTTTHDNYANTAYFWT